MNARSIRLVMGDQLSRGLSALQDADPACDIIVMGEVRAEATSVRHHRKKIAFLFSAMRHFAEDLRREGFAVDYRELDDPENPQDFSGLVRDAIARHRPVQVILTEPSEWRVLQMARNWQEELDCPLEIREDGRFLCSHDAFRAWATSDGKKEPKSLRMEFFYREMRRRTGLLMEGDQPAGGRWNYDHDNRESLPDDIKPPGRTVFEPDAITRQVMDLVSRNFADHFGDLEPFFWPVTASDAQTALDWFIENALGDFGTYQDAMRKGSPFLFHSLLSPLINCGLLDPMEACRRVEEAWHTGKAPLNAVEGFIRQIIGWREYVRGVYWLKMPGYGDANGFAADRALPDFFWTGKTDMACLSAAIAETRQNAYAHHIQRLMVIGNFCLLAGIDPRAVQEWFLIVYADAFEWVEMPNVVGMALHADGGFLGSKPYAASGAYINRMSNYCRTCAFDVKKKEGEGACPFNPLYWDFLLRNERTLSNNARMGLIMKNITRMDEARRNSVRAEAARVLTRIAPT